MILRNLYWQFQRANCTFHSMPPSKFCCVFSNIFMFLCVFIFFLLKMEFTKCLLSQIEKKSKDLQFYVSLCSLLKNTNWSVDKILNRIYFDVEFHRITIQENTMVQRTLKKKIRTCNFSNYPIYHNGMVHMKWNLPMLSLNQRKYFAKRPKLFNVSESNWFIVCISANDCAHVLLCFYVFTLHFQIPVIWVLVLEKLPTRNC